MPPMPLINASQMTLLLNQLGDEAVVRAPLLDNAELFQLDLRQRDAKIEQIISSRAYSDAFGTVLERIDALATQNGLEPTLVKQVKGELPDYNRLRDAFCQAGVEEPTNLHEIRELLRQARGSNPARGGDIYYFAFDNNTLRNRFYSLYIRPCSPRDAHYNLLLAKQVRDELDPREGKILYDFLNAFNTLYPGLSISDIFQNQNRLSDRLRLLGLAEWNAVQQSGDAEVEDAPDARDPDGKIIAAYAKFAQKPGRKVVALSSDNEFITRCSGQVNLTGQIIKYPKALKSSYTASWEAAGRLLYQLAILYGRIDIKTAEGLQTRLYGVWREKGAKEWDQEKLKVTFTPQETPQEQAIRRNLNILEKICDS
ncbi:MAG: hypothetical protein P3X24_005760 [bacterium]|nr:hypothetical protein [bacterium]